MTGTRSAFKRGFHESFRGYFRVSLLCITLFLLLSSRLSAQITFRGTVTTEDKGPQEGTVISLPSLDRNTVTDANGEFIFKDLPSGTHGLIIGRIGYTTINQNILLNKNIEAHYVLVPLNYALDEVVVSGQTKSYQLPHARLGPLGKLTNGDIPFSVHGTSGSLIENRGVHSMADALQTNPTVSVLMSSNTYSSMSRMMIRGFTAADQSELRDGLTDRSFTYVPLENVEHIEVMNGMSGFLYGFSAIGGTVNYISKRPTESSMANLYLGSYGGGIRYVHADVGGHTGSKGGLGYRFNAYREKGHTYIEDSEQARTFLSGVLEQELFPGTTVTADIYHQSLRMDGLQSYFMLPDYTDEIPNAFETTKQYGQPWSYNESQKVLMGISLESKISGNVNLRVAHRYGDMWREYRYVSAILEDDRQNYVEIHRTSPAQLETTRSTYALMDVNFETFKVGHNITFGYTGTDFDYQRGVNVADTLGISNISNPARYEVSSYAEGLTTYQGQNMHNLLVGDRIVFSPKWSSLLGLSYASIKQEAGGIYTGISTSNFKQHKVTPTLSLMFKPMEKTSLYVSYIQGLGTGGTAPDTANNANEILSPAVSDQYELGIKTAIGQLDVTAALFNIDKVNEYIDPADNVYKQDGRQVHKGLEVTLGGHVSKNLLATGGFTVMDANMEQAANNPDIEGKTPINVPEQQARLYIEYTLPFVKDLVLSASGSYLGSRPTDNLNRLELPSVFIFDAGLRYQRAILGHPATLIVNASNILDKDYWINYRTGDGLQLGTPRLMSFTLKYEL